MDASVAALLIGIGVREDRGSRASSLFDLLANLTEQVASKTPGG